MRRIATPNFADPRFKADSYPLYARLRAEAPVYRARLADRQVAWLVTRHDDVAAALKDPRLVKDRLNAAPPDRRGREPWMPGFVKPLTRNMLDLDEPGHARLRPYSKL